jgi:hydrogenase nickel incorporation protein HypA/HybF
MHEVSIALSLLERVIEECQGKGYSRVNSIRVDIGRASGIMPDALSFSFNAIKTDTIAADAELIINEVPLRAQCMDCQSEFASEETYIFMCPACGSITFSVISGRELDITEIEVE